MVTVDLLADLLAAVPSDPLSAGEHLVVFDDRTPGFHDLMTHAAARMGVAAPRWRVPTWLLRLLPSGLTGVDREALSFMSEDRYDPVPMEVFLERTGISKPDVMLSLERWVDALVDTRFAQPG